MGDNTKSKKKFIRRYTTISATIDLIARGELPLLDPIGWEDRNDRYYMQLYKEKREIGGVYALCAATCSETFHHWRVFTSSADGACVELDRARLEVELKRHPNIRAKEVRYKTLNEIADVTTRSARELPFLKRAAFAPEKEYRILAETSEAQLTKIAIPLSLHCIARVLINPWLPEPIFQSIKDLIDSIPGNHGVAVQRSHLLENARWKIAGERIAGNR